MRNALALAVLLLALPLLAAWWRRFSRDRRRPGAADLVTRWLTSVGSGMEPLSALDGYLERIRIATRQGSDPSVSVAQRMAESTEALGAFADAVRGLASAHAAPLADVVEVLRRRLARSHAPPQHAPGRFEPRLLWQDPVRIWQDPAQDDLPQDEATTGVARPLPIRPLRRLDEEGAEEVTQENTLMGRIRPLSLEEAS